MSKFNNNHHHDLIFSVTTNEQLRVCAMEPYVKLQEQAGYLSSHIANERSPGSMSCPWRMEALPGQSISLTLISLGTLSKQHTCKTVG